MKKMMNAVQEILQLKKMNQIEDRLKKISDQVKNDISVQEHRLDSILSALDHIISANEGSSHILKNIKKFEKSEKISSNAKNILQLTQV